MPYPVSIYRCLEVKLDRISTLKKLMTILNNAETDFEFKEDIVKMNWCTEFSSRFTNLQNFNKGEIQLISTNEGTELRFKIFLIEHLVLFLCSLALGVFGLINPFSDFVLVKISGLILAVNFVFCYFYPLMTFNSFIDELRKSSVSK